MTREDLHDSAQGWLSVGLLLLLLAIAGSIVCGIVLAPTEVVDQGAFADPTEETNTAAGLAIGAAVLVGSLVTILPYFILVRLMRGVAELLPSAPPERPPDRVWPSRRK